MKRKDIEQLLPVVFQRTVREGTPMVALLDVMEALHAPAEAALLQIDAALNPRRTPDAFVPFLAGWVDLDRLFDQPSPRSKTRQPFRDPISTGLSRLRELIAIATYLSQWRGTAKGLRLFLETATGEPDFKILEQVAGP